MANYINTDYEHWCRDIREARMKACGYVLDHKRAVVTVTDSRRNFVGYVRYVGPKTGPVYYSRRTDKEYLLDFDGSLWDRKTNKKISGGVR